MESDNGVKYKGDWKDDKPQGKGVMEYADGAKYKGDWKENKRHGKGTYAWPNGDKYEGDWKDDKRYGKGTLVYTNGFAIALINGVRYGHSGPCPISNTSVSSLSATHEVEVEAEAEAEDDDIYNCGICCNSLFGAKIVMCRQGHNLCEMCANKLKNTSSNGHNRKIPQCPTCKVAMKRKFDDPWGRNLFAERLLSLEHKKRRKNPSSVTASK